MATKNIHDERSIRNGCKESRAPVAFTHVACARLLVGGDDTTDGVPDFGDSLLFWLLWRADMAVVVLLRAAATAAAADTPPAAVAVADCALLAAGAAVLLLCVELTVDMRLILFWLETLLAADLAPLLAAGGGYSCDGCAEKHVRWNNTLGIAFVQTDERTEQREVDIRVNRMIHTTETRWKNDQHMKSCRIECSCIIKIKPCIRATLRRPTADG